jgi:hypothetical protein
MLGKQDLLKIGKGALIAAEGAVLYYAGKQLINYNFGQYTVLVSALAAVLVNIGSKLLDGKVE